MLPDYFKHQPIKTSKHPVSTSEINGITKGHSTEIESVKMCQASFQLQTHYTLIQYKDWNVSELVQIEIKVRGAVSRERLMVLGWVKPFPEIHLPVVSWLFLQVSSEWRKQNNEGREADMLLCHQWIHPCVETFNRSTKKAEEQSSVCSTMCWIDKTFGWFPLTALFHNGVCNLEICWPSAKSGRETFLVSDVTNVIASNSILNKIILVATDNNSALINIIQWRIKF